MKIRNIIMTTLLSMGLLVSTTVSVEAMNKEQQSGFNKTCNELVDNKKPKDFAKAINNISPEHILGVFKDSENLKNKKHDDYKVYNVLEDSYNYALFASHKQKESGFNKKEYKAIKSYLKSKANSSINILNGDGPGKINRINKRVENRLIKRLAVMKIQDIKPGKYSTDKNTMGYINMERHELIDKNLKGEEAGMLLDAENLMNANIKGNKGASKKYNDSLKKRLNEYK